VFRFRLLSLQKDLVMYTYLLTPRCRVLLEQLTGLQLVKKFPAFHGTWRFITALTSVRHLSLFWANPIQSIYPHPTYWRSVLILSTHLLLLILSTQLLLDLPSGFLPSGFPSKDWGESVSELVIGKKNNNKKLYTVLSCLGVFIFCTCILICLACTVPSCKLSCV
jgi:hypothetical protein